MYSPGTEILSYLRHVSDKYKVTPLVKLRHELLGAQFDEASVKWQVRVRRPSETDPSGFEEFDDSADFVFSSMGVLSRWNWPEIEGLGEFEGKLLHTADWNVSEEEMATWVNKKVGVIGLVRITMLLLCGTPDSQCRGLQGYSAYRLCGRRSALFKISFVASAGLRLPWLPRR